MTSVEDLIRAAERAGAFHVELLSPDTGRIKIRLGCDKAKLSDIEQALEALRPVGILFTYEWLDYLDPAACFAERMRKRRRKGGRH